MKKLFFIIFLNLTIFIYSCGEYVKFSSQTQSYRNTNISTTNTQSSDLSSNSTQQQNPDTSHSNISDNKPTPDNEPNPNSPIKFYLTIAEQINKEPINLVFMLDNSDSMFYSLNKLEQAIPNLLSQLQTANINFKARILSLSELYLNDKGTSIIGSSKDYLVQVIDKTESIQSKLLAKINDIKSNLQKMDNEPLICLAWDYYIKQLQSSKLSKDDIIHFISITDEDNASQIYTYDKTSQIPKITRTQDLFCHIDNKRHCTKYCYRKKSYRYEVSYLVQGPCQKAGYVKDDETDDLYTLVPTKWCVSNTYTCTKPYQYSLYMCKVEGESQEYQKGQDFDKNYMQCEKASVVCKDYIVEYIDGREYKREQWNYYTYEEYEKIRDQKECKVNWNITDVNIQYTNSPDVRNCKKYICREDIVRTTSTLTVSESEKQKFIDNGYQCVVNDNNKNFEETFSVDYKSYYSYFILNSISPKACPNFYTLQEIERNVALANGNRFCAKNLANVFLPEGVNIKKVAESKSQITQKSFISENQLTKEDIAKKLNIDISLIKEIKANIDYDYPNYYCSEDTPNQYYESLTNVEKKVEQSDSCTRKLAPTAQNFYSILQELNVQNKVFWHSIVNTTGQPCSNDGAVVSKGEDYINLSNLTKGKIYDICNDSYNDFFNNLSQKIIYKTINSYNIPQEYKGENIIRIINETKNIELKKDVDWKIEQNNIIFSEDKIYKDDKIIIEFEP